jgi:hypothetical protein
MGIIGLAVVVVVAVAAYVAYKLYKSGKAVTGTAVVAGVEADAKTVVTDVKNDVTKSS